MPRLWIAVFAIATAALGLLPAVAQASVTQSQINSWVSSEPGTPANDPYLISLDNPHGIAALPTTLTVSGTATASSSGDRVDVVCFYGSTPQYVTLMSNVPVASGQFNTGPVPLRAIAGHACRLRAVPAGSESTIGDASSFAGPQVAVSEAALPSASASGNPYNIYVNAVTFTGYAAWKAAGTNGCGPYAAPIDPAFNIGNFAIDCTGSLLSDDLGVWGGRSEVQVDGRNAYDAASAQALFAAANGKPASQSLPGFPSLSASLQWDPTSALVSSKTTESWVTCNGANAEKPSYATCSSFQDSGVRLDRVISTSDGGRVITMTDTWTSTDGKAHSLDLLYDDYAGVFGNATGQRGWEFPGQSSFSQFGAGASVPAPATATGSILVRTNVSAADGDPNQGFGSITFSRAPAGFRFVGNSELEEHQLLAVPAGGSASLSYVYSVGYSLADVSALAMAVQERFLPPAVTITAPAAGASVSTPAVTLSGAAVSGSGIKSLVVAGQAVPVASGGTWSAVVGLSPGANTITALATDAAGATAQAQVTVLYQPPAPAPAPAPPPSPTSAATCTVPRLKGMKLPAAEKALRRAHCKLGKIRRVKSRQVRRERVMSSTPHAGRRLPAGAKIGLFVSSGR